MEKLITGTPIIDYVEIASHKALSRLMDSALSDTTGLAPTAVFFITYPIAESTSVYSTLYLECKDLVDSVLQNDSQEIVKSVFPGNTLIIDLNGNAFPRSMLKQTMTVSELIDITNDSALFKTVELGCCHTYSHYKYGVKCLAGAIVVWMNSTDLPGAKLRMESYFSKK